jgi:hypothetical protein
MAMPFRSFKRDGLSVALGFLVLSSIPAASGNLDAQTTPDGAQTPVLQPSGNAEYKLCPEIRTENQKDYAKVMRRGSFVVIEANGATPLGPALAAVRDRYGWAVDFEEPVFVSAFDLCETRVSFGRRIESIYSIPTTTFTARYRETKRVGFSPTEEERVLRKIVSDYNQSGDPGKFVVRDEGRGRFSVVGEYVEDDHGRPEKVTPISDTRITIARESRKVYKATDLIVQELGESQAIENLESDDAAFPPNANFEGVVGGTDVPASELLAEAVNSGGRKISWILRWYGGQDGRTVSVILEFSPHVALAGKVLTKKAPMLTYDNGRYGLSLNYRRGYALSKKAQGEYADWSSGENPNWVGLVTIGVPQEAYTDSSLVSAFVSIGVNGHATQKNCDELFGNSEGPTSTIRINGIRFFTTAPTGSVEGGGVSSRTTYYIAFQNGICYEIYVEVKIGTYGLYELGGVVLPVDYDDLERRLRAIVYSVRIRPPKEAIRSGPGGA